MKKKMALLRSKFLFMNVLAEEPNVEKEVEKEVNTDTPEPDEKAKEKDEKVPERNGSVNFEELVSTARKEERDKLYLQIDKLKKDKNDLLLVVAERDKEISGLKKDAEKLKANYSKASKDLEEGTNTNKTVQNLTLTISQLEKQLEDAQTDYETEIQNLKIGAYRDKQIASAGGEIIAELVSGYTEEEIDSSIELAKKRYAEIQERALSNVQMPRASNPATSKLNAFSEKSISEITNMSAKDYAEYRKNLGMK